MARRNFPSVDDRMRYAGRVYKMLIKPLEKAIERAKATNFPEAHINQLEHLLELSKALHALELDPEPLVAKRKQGRPRKEEPTVLEQCARIFDEICPIFIPVKEQKKQGVDSKGKVKPQEGIRFDFSR